MFEALSPESLAAEVSRLPAPLDEQARHRAEAEPRIAELLAGETPELRRAAFTVVPGSARRRTPSRGRLRAVPSSDPRPG